MHQLAGIPRDTTPEAYRVQCNVLRHMSPDQRLRQTFDLIELAENIAAAGIRRRHPDYTPAQVHWRLRECGLAMICFAWPFRMSRFRCESRRGDAS